MTDAQIAIIALLAVTMAAFAANRWRPELIALLALAAAAALGLVTAGSMFSGLSDPAVVTVIEILMLAQLLARSGVIDRIARPALARISTERQLVLFLMATGATLSVFMNNIGALAIMMPVAYSGCRLLAISPRSVLMPLSFATLLGGMCSLVGTPANLVVGAAHESASGASLSFFSFAIAGVPATLIGILWLTATHHSARKGEAPASRRSHETERVLFEMTIPDASSWAGRSVEDVEATDAIDILNIVREGKFVFDRRRNTKIFAGDRLILVSDHAIFDHHFDSGDIDPQWSGSTQVFEAAVPPSSMAIGSVVGELLPFQAPDAAIVGLRGAHLRAEGRFADVRLSVGDVMLVAGDRRNVAAAVEEAGCLLLAGTRKSAPGALTPFAALALVAGVIIAALQLAPPEIAFGAALLATAASGVAALPDLIRRIDWRVVIMLAALIPLAGAFEATGAATAIARPIFALTQGGDVLLIGAIYFICVLITPVLNNVAAAAVMAPIAVAAAQAGGKSVDSLLLAVAAGVSTDFLTPFGHHNNTVVMGAAGYDLTDFLKRGAPLTVIVGVTVVTALALAF